MSVDVNMKLARQWFEELWSLPNLDLADEIIAPEYDPDLIQIDNKSPDQVKHEIRYFRSLFPNLTYEIVEMSALVYRVCVRCKGSGTQMGPAWGFKATSKKIEFEGASIPYVNNGGRIIDRWGHSVFMTYWPSLD